MSDDKEEEAGILAPSSAEAIGHGSDSGHQSANEPNQPPRNDSSKDHRLAASKHAQGRQASYDKIMDESHEKEEEGDDDEMGPHDVKRPAQSMTISCDQHHVNKEDTRSSEDDKDVWVYATDDESEDDEIYDGDGQLEVKAFDGPAASTPRTPRKGFYGTTSSSKGVSFNANGTTGKPWCATAWIDKARISLGYFATEEEAAKAYDKAVRDRYGDKAITNYNADGSRNYDAKGTYGAYIGAKRRSNDPQAAGPSRANRDGKKEQDSMNDNDNDEEEESEGSDEEEGSSNDGGNGRQRRPHDRASRTSMFKGVTLHSGRGKHCWQARLTFKGHMKHLGRFATEKEAALAYDSAARELLGVAAITNYNADGSRNMDAKRQIQRASAPSEVDGGGGSKRSSGRGCASSKLQGAAGNQPAAPTKPTKRKHHKNETLEERTVKVPKKKRGKVMAGGLSTSRTSPTISSAPITPVATVALPAGGLPPGNVEQGLTREQREVVYHVLYNQYQGAQDPTRRQLIHKAIQAMRTRIHEVEEVLVALFGTGLLPEPGQLVVRPDRQSQLVDIMVPLMQMVTD